MNNIILYIKLIPGQQQKSKQEWLLLLFRCQFPLGNVSRICLASSAVLELPYSCCVLFSLLLVSGSLFTAWIVQLQLPLVRLSLSNQSGLFKNSLSCLVSMFSMALLFLFILETVFFIGSLALATLLSHQNWISHIGRGLI